MCVWISTVKFLEVISHISYESRVGLHHVPTFGTSAVFFRSVKYFKVWLEIFLDVFKFEVGVVQLVVTVVAEPQQSIGKATSLAYPLDNETYTTLMANGTVRGLGWNGHISPGPNWSSWACPSTWTLTVIFPSSW